MESTQCYDCCCLFTQADLLDVVGVLYLGGLPQNYTTKRIGPVKDTEGYKSDHTPLKY